MLNNCDIQHFAIFIKDQNEKVKKVASQLVDTLLKFNFEITTIFPFEFKSIPFVNSIIELREKNVDALATIGGDGTILRALRLMDKEIPILGINVGGRGILSEIMPEEIPSAIKNLVESRFFLDRRLRIKSCTNHKIFPPVLNEVFFDRVNLTSLPTMLAKREEEIFLKQKMDGLIIATPTGTTAHTFSGGGPVIYEGMKSFLFMPVYSLERLPSIILPSQTIEISFSDNFHIIIDGQEKYTIMADEWVKITEHERDALFIRFNKKGFRQLHNLGFR